MNRASCFNLTGHRLWIFGGAGYFGSQIVRTVDELGAETVCIDRDNRAEALLNCGSFSDRVRAASLDVHQVETTRKWVQERANADGVPHGAVFLQTPGTAEPLQQLSEASLNRYHEAGLTSLFLLVREIGNLMTAERRGSLVLFSSMYGEVSPDPSIYHAPMPPNPLPYGMHKAAINQMSRYLAVAWGPQNVRCNVVSPGPFPHPGLQRDDPGFMERLAQKTPLKRIGRAEEIAGPVAFLLSDAASYTTGHNLAVNGGWTAW